MNPTPRITRSPLRTSSLLLAIVLAVSAAPVKAATITVTTTLDEVSLNGYVSLREALESINLGASVNADVVPANDPYGTFDEVTFAPGVSTIGVQTEFSITRSVKIVGPGVANLAIVAQAETRLFHAAPGTDLSIAALVIAGGRVKSATLAEGGAILAGRLTLTNCQVSDNWVQGDDTDSADQGASAHGGAIRADVVTLDRTIVESNRAIAGMGRLYGGYALGGAVYASEVHVVDSTIERNRAYLSTELAGDSALEHQGGGIYVMGAEPSTIAGSTFRYNRCPFGIGGALASATPLTLTNSTFAENVAFLGGGLAAFTNFDGSHLTIAGNQAAQAAGALFFQLYEEAAMRLGASVVSDNVADDLSEITLFAYVTSTGYNLLGTVPYINAGDFAYHPTDQIATGTAALLPLDDNGGWTKTMALGSTSTAIDAIPANACTIAWDQRGVARPQNGGCDIGAFEAEPASAATLLGMAYYDANANGRYDAGEAGIAGRPIDFTGPSTVTTGAGGTFQVEVAFGAYSVRQRAPSSSAWVQTGNLENQSTSAGVTLNVDKSYSVDASTGGEYSGLNFGNLCLGGGGAHGSGFWTTKNGQQLIGSDDIAMLVARNLRKADGGAFDPSNASQVKSWLSGATATNMAYALSAQLAAMELDVLNGFVGGARMIRVAGSTSANAAGFATVTQVMAEANAELGAHGSTPAGSPHRAYQEALKNALENANVNRSFVQASAASCPAPF